MEKFDFKKAYETIEANEERQRELLEALENDKQREDFTEAEKAEMKKLQREVEFNEMKIKANTQMVAVEKREDISEANAKLREAINNSQRVELRISRAVSSSFAGNTSGYANPLASTNPFGLTTGDIVEPLYANNILSAIGAPLLTGLKGNYQWPVVEAFSASINDEGVALGDTKIPLNKLIAKPERIGVAVPVTREALNETDDLLLTVATKYVPTAVSDLMNKIMLNQTKVAGATNLVGPFVNVKTANKKTYSGEVPSYNDILSLKGAVLGSNIRPEQLCYCMTETTKALLEGTPKWDGAATPIVDENGTIAGVPIYTSSYCNEGEILFGSFKYAPQGLFGDMNLVIDPYTQARKNAVDFVLNVDYAITVLRQEAFAILTKKAG